MIFLCPKGLHDFFLSLEVACIILVPRGCVIFYRKRVRHFFVPKSCMIFLSQEVGCHGYCPLQTSLRQTTNNNTPNIVTSQFLWFELCWNLEFVKKRFNIISSSRASRSCPSHKPDTLYRNQHKLIFFCWENTHCLTWLVEHKCHTLMTHKSWHPPWQLWNALTRLFKSNYFCATNISVQKFCANQMGQKPTKKFEIWPQKGKTVVNCAFLRSKTQILRNIWKILRDRTVARSHLSETLALTPIRAGLVWTFLTDWPPYLDHCSVKNFF